MLKKMNLKPVDQQDLLIDKMVLAHMNGLASCVELPQENKRTLEYIKTQGYRMAIVSNFDYAPTAYKLLDNFEITNLFEEIVISEEVGWRKPKDIIFQTAITKLDI